MRQDKQDRSGPRPLPRVTSVLGAALVTLGAAAPTLGDDTEIFVQAVPPGDPNVLLILDTSGSMTSELVVSDEYDPMVTYPGSCVDGRVYWAEQANVTPVPDCNVQSFAWFNESALRCDAAIEGLQIAGFYTDRVAQWSPVSERWDRLRTAGDPVTPPPEERFAECRGDGGVHGDGADANALWAIAAVSADEPGPWTADPANELDWLAQRSYTLYSANYLNWLAGDRDSRVSTRMEVLKDVGQALLSGLGGVNVGLMRFSSDADGGMVVQPVVDVDDPANRLAILAAIEALKPGGDTPLAETLFEAQRYLSGGSVLFGLDSIGNDGEPQPSVAAARDGDTYVSPLDQRCQATYAVLLTDGLPVSDSGADALIQDLTGGACDGSCLDELSRWLADNDQSAAQDGDQVVKTYTIGFFTDSELLRDTATATRPDNTPGYYTADDVLSLTDALRQVFTDIAVDNRSFQSPAVAVDGFNRLVNSDELYFSMFIPSAAPFWAGNIKKYRLTSIDGAPQIVDADGQVAVGADGVFVETARGLWASEPDGADVKLGGFRNRMGTDRRIYTDTAFARREVVLTAPENRFIETNPALTAQLLNVPEADREATIRFLRGVDADDNAAPILGDPLHSNPTLVSFADGQGGTRLKMFVATNDGYFHAISVDPQTDTEALEDFSFVPAGVLSRLPRILENEPLNPARKAYGLDGPISFWIKDDDGDNIVESGETLYVYVAMRRGGRSYYALRIPGSAPDQPMLAWTLPGGLGNFAELGQSWSAATVARMNVGGEARTVLVLGGGYDDVSQDIIGPPRTDTVGRAVFVIDAETGERLWWAGPPDAGLDGDQPDLILNDMTNSIPSDVAVIDTGGDGLADRLYVGDTGARVWRFDVTDLAGEVSGTVLADLGSETLEGNRRFYYKPSVSRVIDPRFGSFLTVSLGSGHRASPLSPAVDDNFFMLRDRNVFAPPRDGDGEVQYPPPIVEADLLDITDLTAPTAVALNGASGWVLRLPDDGEKVLAPALTADNKIFFSTYLPNTGFQPSCDLAGVLGAGRLYTVDLVSGAPVLLDDPIDDGLPLPADRYRDLGTGGIPPAPRLVFTPCPNGNCDGDGDDPGDDPDAPPPDDTPVGGTGCSNAMSQVTLLLGTQASDPNICNAPVRTYWRQNR